MQDDDEIRGRLLTRRQALALMGGAALVAVVGCSDDDGGSASATPTSDAAQDATPTAAATSAPASAATDTGAATATATAVPVSCVVTPEKTEGPYFVDERLNRSDITSDPTDGSVKHGVPLTVTMIISELDRSSCTPLPGVLVDMWHCDALGAYSDVSGQADTTGQKFLRGYQITDDNGQVQFQTIYPGWYSGRTIHIHFKVRTEFEADSGHEFTSQLFFDESITDTVVATREPYAQKGTPNVRNANDGIYDSQLIIALGEDGDGYEGTFHVGVDFA